MQSLEEYKLGLIITPEFIEYTRRLIDLMEAFNYSVDALYVDAPYLHSPLLNYRWFKCNTVGLSDFDVLNGKRCDWSQMTKDRLPYGVKLIKSSIPLDLKHLGFSTPEYLEYEMKIYYYYKRIKNHA